MSHIVVCHGYSLGENPKLAGVKNANGEWIAAKHGDWEEVCLGGHGRIHTTLRLASEVGAAEIIRTTGASFYDDVSEAQYMFRVADKEMPFSAWGRSNHWLWHISSFEEKSVNGAFLLCRLR